MRDQYDRARELSPEHDGFFGVRTDLLDEALQQNGCTGQTRFIDAFRELKKELRFDGVASMSPSEARKHEAETGVKARGKHWAATSVDMHVASELLNAVADAVLEKADCDKGDFDVRPVYYADKPAAAAAAAAASASTAGVANGIHEHHDPTGGRRNESRLMVTITVTHPLPQ